MLIGHEINNTVAVITPGIATIRQRTQDDLTMQVLQIMEEEVEKLKNMAKLCCDVEIPEHLGNPEC